MRVLHLDAGRTMRGGQWQVLRLIGGLAAEGVESTLLAPAGCPLFEAVRAAGFRVEPLGLMRAGILARRHEVIHAHDSRSHTLAALAGGAPLVVSRRVAFGGGAGPLSRWKYARAKGYIAVSEFVKSVLESRGIPAQSITVVYDGVPVDQASGPAREKRAGLILAPGYSGDPQKGTVLALESARLAGAELKLSSNLEPDLGEASLFLYLTHSEGLGSGALLAMAAGVPVIASKIGGLPEVIRHGENGVLVENAPESIATALRLLLDDPALAARLGAAGRQTVIERFSVELMVRRTMEVYRQVLS